MTIAEKIAQIKKLVFANAAQASITHQLPDGRVLTVNSMQPGADVLVNGSPAAEGVYTLADGTQITLSAGSKISAISPGNAQPGTGADYDTDGDASEAFKAVKQQLQNHEQAFAAYCAATDKKLAEHAQQMEKHHQAMQQMFDLVHSIATAPAQPAPEAPKAKFSFSKVADRKEMMNRYLQAMDEIKKSAAGTAL